MNNSSSVTTGTGAMETANGSNSSVLMTNLVSGMLLATFAYTVLLTIAKLTA